MRLRYLFYNLLIVIVVLALVELVSRFILSKVYNRNFDSSLIIDNKYFSSAGLKENAKGSVWGKPFRTDEFGCRKNARPFNPKKKKWLFIGDSVTQGVGVDDSSTFASLVSKEQDSLNVMNYSLIGYSSEDYYNVVRSLVKDGDTSISRVTIFFCLNDVYGSAKTKELPVMAKQNWKGKLNSFLQDRYATYKLLKLLMFAHSDRYFNYDDQFYKNDDPHFIESMQYLSKCDSICKVAGIRMNVVSLPYRSQLVNDYFPVFTPQHRIEMYCYYGHITFWDATSFLNEMRLDTRKRCYLFADEIHLSKTGHELVSKFISYEGKWIN